MDEPYRVIYLINESNTRVIRGFNSPYLARKLANKIKRSKRCTLLTCVGFFAD